MSIKPTLPNFEAYLLGLCDFGLLPPAPMSENMWLKSENERLRAELADRDNAEMMGLRTALTAMKLAAAIPAIAEEYDFEPAITEVSTLLMPRPQ